VIEIVPGRYFARMWLVSGQGDRDYLLVLFRDGEGAWEGRGRVRVGEQRSWMQVKFKDGLTQQAIVDDIETAMLPEISEQIAPGAPIDIHTTVFDSSDVGEITRILLNDPCCANITTQAVGQG